MTEVAKRYLSLFRRHPVVASLAVLASVILTVATALRDQPLVPVMLSIASIASVLVADALSMRDVAERWTVRRPLLECGLLFVNGCVVFAFILWLKRNGTDAAREQHRLLFLGGALCFLQIVSTLAFRLSGYRFGQLGLVPRKPQVIAAVAAICAAVLLASSRRLPTDAYTRSGGAFSYYLQSLLLAALPEEIMRQQVQSRFGALTSNDALGWFLATLIWASLHLPDKFRSDDGVAGTLLRCGALVPWGLALGYLTHRTRSIWPAVLAHAILE